MNIDDRSTKEVSIKEKALQTVLRLGAPIVLSGSQRVRNIVPEPSELNLDVKRITFRGCSGEEVLIKRRLRNMEDLGKIGVVVMSKDEKTREYLEGNSLWWGWTLVSRGDVYTIQMVVFLKPKKASFLGEADQGSLYELDMADVAPWDGQVHVNARTAA